MFQESNGGHCRLQCSPRFYGVGPLTMGMNATIAATLQACAALCTVQASQHSAGDARACIAVSFMPNAPAGVRSCQGIMIVLGVSMYSNSTAGVPAYVGMYWDSAIVLPLLPNFDSQTSYESTEPCT